MENTSSKTMVPETTVSLLCMLKKYTKIKIPMIQRAYAQGREEEKTKLEEFLNDIKEHLNDIKEHLNDIKEHLNEPEKTYSLDYIYGVQNSDGEFYPLDGQQRITTLWLVHWYIANALNIKSSDFENLKKFTYDTRDSSREFCKELCSEKIAINENSLSATIKNKHWFFAAWELDPSVKAMLDALDIINEYFYFVVESNDTRYWEALKSIVFELLDISTEKQINEDDVDDLYIKINERGQKLTGFENFKSVWTSEHKRYSKLIDGIWTDIFWNASRCEDEKKCDKFFDDMYLLFVTKAVFNKMCVDGIDDKTPEFKLLKAFENGKNYKSKGIKNEPEKHKVERGNKAVDTNKSKREISITYQDYKEYIEKIMPDLKDVFQSFTTEKVNIEGEKEITADDSIKVSKKIEDTIKDSVGSLKFRAKEKNFKFFKKAEDGTTQKERAYFHAVFCFLKYCEDAKDFLSKDKNFKDWIRVSRNLIENAEISSDNTMIKCIQLIDKIAACDIAKTNIYEILKEQKASEPSSMLDEQYKEEIEKAAQISEDINFKEDIQEAEDFSFFNGTIRFLYRDENDNKNWKDFRCKFKNAKDLFNNGDENGTENGNIVPSETTFKLIRTFGSFNEIKMLNLFITTGYTSKHGEDNFRDNILCGNLTESEKKSYKKEKQNEDDFYKKKREYVEKLLKGDWSKLDDLKDDEQMGISESNYNFKAFIDNKQLITELREVDGNNLISFNKGYGCYQFKVPHASFNDPKGALYIHKGRKEKSEAFKEKVDSGKIKIISLNHEKTNEFYRGEYYWANRIVFEYQGHCFVWFVREQEKDKNKIDKITFIHQEDKKIDMINKRLQDKKYIENWEKPWTEPDKLEEILEELINHISKVESDNQ